MILAGVVTMTLSIDLILSMTGQKTLSRIFALWLSFQLVYQPSILFLSIVFLISFCFLVSVIAIIFCIHGCGTLFYLHRVRTDRRSDEIQTFPIRGWRLQGDRRWNDSEIHVDGNRTCSHSLIFNFQFIFIIIYYTYLTTPNYANNTNQSTFSQSFVLAYRVRNYS